MVNLSLEYTKYDINVVIKFHARFWLQVNVYWSNMGIMTVFWPNTSFQLGFTNDEYWFN